MKYTFFTLLFLSIVMTVIFFFTSNLARPQDSTENIADLILTERILSSSLIFNDNYIHRGIFNQDLDEELDLLTDVSGFGARLELKDLITGKDQIGFINKKYYDRISPLAVKKFEGKFNKNIMRRYVLVKQGSKFNGAILRVDYARQIE
jgi:hypothetical protein